MRCSICEGNVVNGRCAECGMLMPDERNRYHLNENMRDHKAYCEAPKQREVHEKHASCSGDEKKKTARTVKAVIGIVILLFVILFAAGVIEEMQTDVGVDLEQWFEE